MATLASSDIATLKALKAKCNFLHRQLFGETIFLPWLLVNST